MNKWIITGAQRPPVGQIVEGAWKIPSIEGFMMQDCILDNDGSWRLIAATLVMGMNVPPIVQPNFWRALTRGPDIDGVEHD